MVNNSPDSPTGPSKTDDTTVAKTPRAPKIVVKLSSVAKRAPSALRTATRILTPPPQEAVVPKPAAVPLPPALPTPAPQPVVVKAPPPVTLKENKPVLAPPKEKLPQKPVQSIFDEVPPEAPAEHVRPVGWKPLEAGELPVDISQMDPFAKIAIDHPPEKMDLKSAPAPVPLPVVPQRKTSKVKVPEELKPQEIVKPPVPEKKAPVLSTTSDLFLVPPPAREPAAPLPEPKVPEKIVHAPKLIEPVQPHAPVEGKLPAPKKRALNWFNKPGALALESPTAVPLELPVVEAKAAPILKKEVPAKGIPLPTPLAKKETVAPAPKTLVPAETKKTPPLEKKKTEEEFLPGLVPVVPPIAAPVEKAGAETLPAPKSTPVPEDTAEKRAERMAHKRLMETIGFYTATVAILIGLYYGSMSWFPETRVEGQVIPPQGMALCNQAWIVEDFSSLAQGVAEDLAGDRTPRLEEIAERRDALQRVRADIAGREERITLLQQQIQSTRDDITNVVKQAHDQVQAIWDGAGADLEKQYDAQLAVVEKTIGDRAKQLKLNYQPNADYRSPEVWANAYRLALYQPPKGVDAVKEHAWIEDQLNKWRDFTKSLDDQQQHLRDQAAQIQTSPNAKVADLNAHIDDLQHKVDDATADEQPLKRELEEDQASLAQSLASEGALDAKYYQQLSGLPQSSILGNIRFPLSNQGRFSWKHVEKDAGFTHGQMEHSYWIFFRAIRSDGREFWSLQQFTVQKNNRLELIVEPTSFLSTRAILRPDLPPDDGQQ